MKTALTQLRYDLDFTRTELALIHGTANAAGRDLAWKFFGLGRLEGKSVADIIAGVGLPTRRLGVNGRTLREWQAPGYRIALQFDAQERVVKVAVESAWH